MALERKDRRQDTTTTTGTGTISLGGTADTGYLPFDFTNGATVRYLIQTDDKSEWEVGEGVFTEGTPDTLSRATIYASSNSGSAVNFSAGTKKVYCVAVAEDLDPASGTDINDGTDDAKFVTSKAVADSWIGVQGGWSPISDTVTYSSVDDPTGVVTIAGDYTGILSAGMRIKMTNGGNTIYGIITKTPTYSAPNTTLTFLHEIDPTDSQALHLLANSAITEVYYSHQKAPFGFPLEKTKWTVKVTDTTARSKASPSGETWYYTDFGSINIEVPIGSWAFGFELCMACLGDLNDFIAAKIALSTSSSSSSDSELESYIYVYSEAATISDSQGNTDNIKREKDITITSKTTYYLIARRDAGIVDSLTFRNDKTTLVLKAVCAYL